MIDIETSITALLRNSAERLRSYFEFDDIPEIILDVPKESSFGDLATNIALQIGHRIRHPAKEIAHIMVDYMKSQIKNHPYEGILDSIEVGAPGFINFFLKQESLYYILEKIKTEDKNFGRNNMGKRTRLNLEFVSANPTGPLTIAHGRQAAFGDSLANILEFAGYRVKREYYINDEGRQIRLLGSSIRARYLELIGEPAEFPTDGYRGDYITHMASRLKDRYNTKKKDAPGAFYENYGYKLILKDIKEDLKTFGVKFDTWFSQRSLMRGGKIKKAFSILEKSKLLYKKDGALWLNSSRYGDEKDRVVVKSDSSYTYLGPDIAYHMDKYKRSFKKLIDIWGPDHHGYIPRIKAAVIGLGHDKESISTLIVQLVTLYRGKTPVPMSTRAGSFITLKEVVNEIGRDVARFFFLRRRRNSHLDFDLELAKKHSMDNPVYYIQYAHARICSILKYEKKESGIFRKSELDLNLLKSKEEFKILRILRQFPLVIDSSAKDFEPYRLLIYLEELAKGFHSFYNKHRVVSQDEAATRARLLLVECVKIVIANGLRLLGVAAPTSM